MTTHRYHPVILAIVCTAACCSSALAQQSAPTIVEIDIENLVEYQVDTLDTSNFATNPNVTVSSGIMRLGATVIGDIVAVNGEPAKGSVVGRPWTMDLTPLPTPGRAIADVTRGSSGFRTFEILKPDGTAVGTLMVLGLNGGVSPPGAPFGGQNFAIVGGTGAFLGARGQQGGMQTPQTIPPRAASITEDPANRRRNGGGRVRWLLAIIPMARPEVITSNGEPLIAHANDSSLVTPSNPASAGETLYLFATGLGPTNPGVDYGQPFPSSPRSVVNSPLKVTVNGTAAEVLVAAGFPGRVDTYQIQFRIPAGIAPGSAVVQISAAWIPGAPVTIPIR
jgi:uncharacterized protein (TIGR03437 family)